MYTDRTDTVGTLWIKLLAMPIIVVIAFIMFCSVLVVYVIGFIDPHSSPAAELRKLFAIYAAIYRAIKRFLETEI